MKALLCLKLSLLFINPAHSLQKFEKVLVTTKKQKTLKIQNLYESSLNQEDLKDFNLHHTDNIWDFIPNLNTSGGSNRFRYLQIRGVGERSEFDTVPTTSVGFYYDHIDLSGLGGIAQTYDVERIQVLKGPQSHIFGDSSIGGNVLINSKYSTYKELSTWAGAGSQNQKRVGARMSLPLSEDLSFKVGGQKSTSDGFTKNTFTKKNTNKRDEVFLNTGFSYLSSFFELKSSHIFADQESGFDVFSTESRFKTRSDRPGADSQKTLGNSIEFTGFLDKKSSISLITSLSDSDVDYSFDEDWGNNALWQSTPGWNQNYNFNKIFLRAKQNLHSKLIYQIQFSDYVADLGLHYVNRKDLSDITSFKNGLERERLQSKFISEHFAYFSSLKRELSESFSFSLSGRIEKQKIDYQDTNDFTGSPSTNLYGFKASLVHKSEHDILTAKISRGYKGAGFNPEQNLSREQQFYGAESLINHELQWVHQSTLLENKMTLFYMNRRNQQIQTSTQDNPSDPSDFTVFIDNAAKSENFGLENELHLMPYKPFSLKINLGLLKARFKEHTNQGVDFTGREMAHSPSYTYAVSGIFKPSKKWSFNINLTGKDGFYFSNSHSEVSSSYGLLSSSLTYNPTRVLELSLWGRNLLDRIYSIRGFYFGNEPPDFNPRLYTQPGAPLEYGLQITWSPS